MDDLNLEKLSQLEREDVVNILIRNQKAIQIPGEALGRCTIVQHHIYTDGEKPLYQAPYRVQYQQMGALKEIKEMEEQGVNSGPKVGCMGGIMHPLRNKCPFEI